MRPCCSCASLARALVFLVALGLMAWRAHDCLAKFLEFPVTSVVRMVPMQQTTMPVLVICPAYNAAYKEDKIKQLGITSSEAYKEGDIQGNSSKDERSVFEDITYGKAELIDTMDVRFPLDKEKKTKINLNADAIQTREIKYPTLGKCFEVDLAQFAEPLESVYIKLKLPGYVYVNIKGNFFNADSYSKVEVKLRHCLYIELTYELMNHMSDDTCRKYETETYDDCCERAAEDFVVETFNCTLPYTNTGNRESEMSSSGLIKH